MARSYDALSGALHRHGIPHTDAWAAMFCWIDLREYLAEPTWEGERQLWAKLAYDFG